MKIPFDKIILSENETRQIAEEFSSLIIPGDIILLNGQLGSGKTFFIKAVCNKLGIPDVSSPSFAIVNEYHGLYKIYHFDFFRVEKAAELTDIGFDDYLNEQDAIVFIEWPDLFSEVLPGKNYCIKLELLSDGKREIKITYN